MKKHRKPFGLIAVLLSAFLIFISSFTFLRFAYASPTLAEEVQMVIIDTLFNEEDKLSHPTASVLSITDLAVSVDIGELAYPGDSVTVLIKAENTGSVSTKLESIELNAPELESFLSSDYTYSNKEILPGNSHNAQIKISWDEEYQGNIEEKITGEFQYILHYVAYNAQSSSEVDDTSSSTTSGGDGDASSSSEDEMKEVSLAPTDTSNVGDGSDSGSSGDSSDAGGSGTNSGSSGSGTHTSPDTGDNSNLKVWLLLLAGSSLVLFVVLISRRRNREEENLAVENKGGQDV